MDALSLLERPMPKPRRNLHEYAAARTLEAVLEAILALEFLGKSYTRNAAGKAFQAWKALIAALLALEHDKILRSLKDAEQRKWFTEKAVPWAPTTRLKALSQILEDLGYTGLSQATSMALDLHDYHYHGPDPEAELSKYTRGEEAAKDIVLLVRTITELVEKKLKPVLGEKKTWKPSHENALSQLRSLL